ncbi:MAG: hypothetical protein RLN85_06675 [Pseudomonadales bacterium]
MIIGLAGRIGCRKSTVAEYLEKKHFYHRHRMADPLKNMLRTLGLCEREIEGDWKQTPRHLLGGKTPRFAMQTLGTEWGREMISPDSWTNAWEENHPYGDVVCEDVRFANEADAVRSVGGIVVRILRGEDDEAILHPSELMDFKADFIVVNHDTIDNLCAQVMSIIDHVQSGAHTETFGSLRG